MKRSTLFNLEQACEHGASKSVQYNDEGGEDWIKME